MAFLDTQVCINNPYLQSRILTFLCKYNIVILDTQISSWMCFSKCLLEYYQSFMRNQGGKTELHKKVQGVNFVKVCKQCKSKLVWRTSFFWFHILFPLSFFIAFFTYSLPLSKWRACWMAPAMIYNNITFQFCYNYCLEHY